MVYEAKRGMKGWLSKKLNRKGFLVATGERLRSWEFLEVLVADGDTDCGLEVEPVDKRLRYFLEG